MPVALNILADRGLVYLRFSGVVTVDETMKAVVEMGRDPNFSVGLRHFADYSDVVDYAHDYVEVLALQANLADDVVKDGVQTLLVQLATTPKGREMANLAVKSWDGIGGVVPVIAESEARALSLLGEPETSISELLANA